MKLLYLVLSFSLLNMSLAVEVQEQEIWKPAEEPKTYEEARELYYRKENEQKAAEEKLEKSKTEDEKNEAKLELARAQRDKAVAELGMAETSEGLARMKNDGIITAKITKDDIKANAAAADSAIINEYVKNLGSKTTIVGKDPAIAFRNISDQLQQTIALFDIATSDDIAKIERTLESLKGQIDEQTGKIKIDAAKKTNLIEKLDTIHSQRARLEALRETVDRELEKKIIKKDPKFQTKLNDLTRFLEKKVEDFTKESIAARGKAKPESWISEKISQFRDWFDRSFDFHKTSIEKRTIKEEVEMFQSIKDKSEGGLSLIKDINDLNSGAQQLNERMKTIETYNEARGVISEAEGLLISVGQLEKTPINLEQLGIYADLSNDAKKIEDDLVAKSHRYRGDSPNLFNKLATWYEDLWGNYGYGIADAYKILGKSLDATQEELLAAKEQIAASEANDSVKLAARQASFILTQPVHRETYNAFLKDYHELIGGDPNTGRDPLRPDQVIEETFKSTNVINYLNSNKAALSKLEIKNDVYEKILGTDGVRDEVLDFRASLPQKIEKMIPGKNDLERAYLLNEKIEETKKLLNKTLAAAEQTLQRLRSEGP